MKVHIVQVITRLELGGAQKVTLYTARNLDRRRYDVSLVTGGEDLLTDEARCIPEMAFYEVPELVREISPARDLVALAKLYRIFRGIVRSSPGGVIVHTHSSKAGILGRWAARLAGASRVVHSIHGYGFNDYQSPLKRWALKSAERVTSRVTHGFAADSYANIEKGRRNGLFGKSHVEVIRSGIPVGFFAARPEAADWVSPGLPGGGPLVTMVSCLKPQKAPVDFVRVAAQVATRQPDARFVLVGDGELRQAVLEEAVRLGISGRLHLAGWRDDVRDIIHASEVVVLTSLWEGLPLVVLMASAAGKPVVATAVDGTPEAVKDGINGFLAAPHDVELMADRVGALLEDKELAARMGAAGRAIVAEFDESEMLRRIEKLYDGLLKEEL